MRFQVLGPLEIHTDQQPIRIPGTRRRALLATLLFRAGKVVSIPRLIDDIWDVDPPESAVFNIRTYVHGIRRTLRLAGDSPDRLVHDFGGYCIHVAPEELDLLQFEQLATDGHGAMRQGQHVLAADCFSRALSLWHGDSLEDLPAVGIELMGAVAALEERRRLVASAFVDAEIMLERFEDVMPHLRQMAAERPLCERTRAQLVVVLHRLGRTAEALEEYRNARRTVISELGVEPGAALQRVHQSVLDGRSPLSLPWQPAARPAANVRGPGRDATAPLPRGLPPRPPGFVGRMKIRRQLAEIGMAVGSLPRTDAHAAVLSISGPPGVGKSALAVAVAYDLRSRFMNGQIFVSLDGSTDHPRAPVDVLAELLSALNVEASGIPKGLGERTTLFRSLAADRQLLLVLDDAASAEHVGNLLPGAGRCVTLVTSRLQLLDLEVAYRLNLGPLSDLEAVQLLSQVAGHDCFADTPDVSARIVNACERLPLALRIAGARLSIDGGISATDLAERLEIEECLLDELAVGDFSVRTRLSQSYRALDPTSRGALRTLAASDQSTMTDDTIARLLGRRRLHVGRIIERLLRNNLLTPVTAAGGHQYEISTLLRTFVRQSADPAVAPV